MATATDNEGIHRAFLAYWTPIFQMPHDATAAAEAEDECLRRAQWRRLRKRSIARDGGSRSEAASIGEGDDDDEELDEDEDTWTIVLSSDLETGAAAFADQNVERRSTTGLGEQAA